MQLGTPFGAVEVVFNGVFRGPGNLTILAFWGQGKKWRRAALDVGGVAVQARGILKWDGATWSQSVAGAREIDAEGEVNASVRDALTAGMIETLVAAGASASQEALYAGAAARLMARAATLRGREVARSDLAELDAAVLALEE